MHSPAPNNSNSLTPSEFAWFREHLRSLTGIVLGESKTSLMQGRLLKRLKALQLPDYGSYRRLLTTGKNRAENKNFINALTTNMTSFFREPIQLERAAQLCQDRLNHKTVFAWSAASSTGEEAFSLAMLLEEQRRISPSFDYRILGTDINTEVLRHGETALYSPQDVEAVPQELRCRYCRPVSTANSPMLRIAAPLRERTKFRPLNLTQGGPQTLSLKFDMVFLRNVLIYFPADTAARVVREISFRLKPGGQLYLGASESVDLSDSLLKKVASSCYERVGTA